MAGTPSPMGYAKIHASAEMSGFRVVLDESSTGLRYSRGNVPEDLDTVEEMVTAIAQTALCVITLAPAVSRSRC